MIMKYNVLNAHNIPDASLGFVVKYVSIVDGTENRKQCRIG